MKLNSTQQLLIYADDVNKGGGNIDTIKKNTKAVVIASKEAGLEVLLLLLLLLRSKFGEK